jgi:hypothetical protein
MRGARTQEATALIVGRLFSAIRTSAVVELAGAGHMGPLTHAEQVCGIVAKHIAACEADKRGAVRDAEPDVLPMAA